jgi:hypothetical protein
MMIGWFDFDVFVLALKSLSLILRLIALQLVEGLVQLFADALVLLLLGQKFVLKIEIELISLSVLIFEKREKIALI